MGNSSRPFIVLRKASAQWKWIDLGHTSLDVLPYNLHPWAAFDEEQCRRERIGWSVLYLSVASLSTCKPVIGWPSYHLIGTVQSSDHFLITPTHHLESKLNLGY